MSDLNKVLTGANEVTLNFIKKKYTAKFRKFSNKLAK